MKRIVKTVVILWIAIKIGLLLAFVAFKILVPWTEPGGSVRIGQTTFVNQTEHGMLLDLIKIGQMTNRYGQLPAKVIFREDVDSFQVRSASEVVVSGDGLMANCVLVELAMMQKKAGIEDWTKIDTAVDKVIFDTAVNESFSALHLAYVQYAEVYRRHGDQPLSETEYRNFRHVGLMYLPY